MILELCKGVHCVDLGESFPTSLYLQHFVSIQPRTSPVKFAASRRFPRSIQSWNFFRCAWSSVKSSGEAPRGPFPYCRAHAWTVRPTRVRCLSLSQPQPTSKTFRLNIWGSVRYLSLTWKADVCSCQPICINFGFRDNSEMWSHDSYLEPRDDRW